MMERQSERPDLLTFPEGNAVHYLRCEAVLNRKTMC
jgi:hypothetical protein